MEPEKNYAEKQRNIYEVIEKLTKEIKILAQLQKSKMKILTPSEIFPFKIMLK